MTSPSAFTLHVEMLTMLEMLGWSCDYIPTTTITAATTTTTTTTTAAAAAAAALAIIHIHP